MTEIVFVVQLQLWKNSYGELTGKPWSQFFNIQTSQLANNIIYDLTSSVIRLAGQVLFMGKIV